MFTALAHRWRRSLAFRVVASTLVAATSGISAVIGPDGTLEWRTEEFTPDTTVATVPMRTGITPAMRLGELPTLAALALLLGLLALGRRHRRGRRRPSPATSNEHLSDPRAHGRMSR